MKALLLTNKPFLPTIDGGTAASWAFVEQLISENFDLKAITYSSEKHPFHSELYVKDPWRNLEIKNVHLTLQPNIFTAFMAMLQNKSYQITRFQNAKLLKEFTHFSALYHFDYVILDSLYSGAMIEKLKKIMPRSKFVLRAHNVESSLAMEKANLEKKGIIKWYLKVLANQLERREKKIIQQCDILLPISELDTNYFRKWTSNSIFTFPYFPLKSDLFWIDKSNFFMHFGAMNWHPNVLAYAKLKEKIFPAILKSIPKAQLKVAGSFMQKMELSDCENIEELGFVENKYDFLCSNGILLAPIENASGVRVKILEALSLGVPVITTTEGARGIPIENGNGIIICKNDEEFIQQAIILGLDGEKRKELSKKAKHFFNKWRSDCSLKTIFEVHAG